MFIKDMKLFAQKIAWTDTFFSLGMIHIEGFCVA